MQRKVALVQLSPGTQGPGTRTACAVKQSGFNSAVRTNTIFIDERFTRRFHAKGCDSVMRTHGSPRCLKEIAHVTSFYLHWSFNQRANAVVGAEIILNVRRRSGRGQAFGFVYSHGEQLAAQGTLPRQQLRSEQVAGHERAILDSDTHPLNTACSGAI